MQDTREILKKIRRIELRTRRLVDSMFAGSYHSVFKGRGMNFEEVREYTPGDEIRSIDWNVTARMNTPFVKKFTEERELTVMLVVDVSASGNFGSVNRLHTLRLIREMLFFKPKHRGTNLTAALEYLNKVVTRRAVVFLISDFMDEGYSRPLAIAARRHDLIAIPVVDPGEEDLPDVGIVTLEDPETGEQIDINTSNRALRGAYLALEDRRKKSVEQEFLKVGIDMIPLRTNEDYLHVLRAFFARREKRRFSA